MILGSALGVLGHGDVGHDLGHDLGHDVEHDVGHDTEHDSENEARSGHAGALDLNADTLHGLSWALSFLGVGRVPFTVLLMVCALLFGGAGMCMNYLIAPALSTVPAMALISIGVAFAAMIFLTGAIARIVSRLMPSTETYIASPKDLLGTTGTIIVETSTQSGFAHVLDQFKNLQQIGCRATEGTLPIGTEIVVIDRREEDVYTVEPFKTKLD
jgi:membrane protein implicated in regulation of membrane protease activity